MVDASLSLLQALLENGNHVGLAINHIKVTKSPQVQQRRAVPFDMESLPLMPSLPGITHTVSRTQSRARRRDRGQVCDPIPSMRVVSGVFDADRQWMTTAHTCRFQRLWLRREEFGSPSEEEIKVFYPMNSHAVCHQSARRILPWICRWPSRPVQTTSGSPSAYSRCSSLSSSRVHPSAASLARPSWRWLLSDVRQETHV